MRFYNRDPPRKKLGKQNNRTIRNQEEIAYRTI